MGSYNRPAAGLRPLHPPIVQEPMAVEQRYRVVERLEAGGMAEVFKGESLSVQGFKKQVAIKRVLPHLAQNKNFISMFLDEARLGARLTHANIVTVFDIGAADNTYFIVMEFVDGCNLKTVIETYRQQGQRIGVKESLFIAMEACKGLSFAHDLEGEDGKPLHIVHRDVSPPNVLISKRGEIKVTDFGLAKATTQLEKTDPGVVKGKFSYLSPEAALGQPVDARTDVFALGIVLWEMLAGRRLFLGETDFQTVKMVQQAQIPSLSRINPQVDAELEGVITKALTQDTASRYQSAHEFQDGLAGYLFSRKLKVTSYDIATLIKQVISQKQHIKKGDGPQQQSIIDRLIQEELLRFTSLDDMGNASPVTPAGGDDDDGSKPLDGGLFENPADWFRDDNDVQSAARESKPATPSEPGWRESGVEGEDLATILGERASGTSQEPPPPDRISHPGPPPRQAAPKQGETPSKAPPKSVEAAPKPSSGGGAMIYVALAIVLAIGAGAAAWFGGIIPH
jgi:eukaryotic-like serine/threonine-protein kinase